MKYSIIPVTEFFQNCSILWCEKTNEGVIVDPGGESIYLRKKIDNSCIKITQIWLTHGHIDHVGAAVELSEYYKIPIIGPNIEDKLLLDNLPNQCKMFKMKIIPSIIPDQWLSHGDKIKVGKETFHILHCPGHSPGHIIFFNKKKHFIIMGDVLFQCGMGRSDLPGGDYRALIHSIYYKILPLGEENIFLPGHGKITTIREAIKHLIHCT